MKEDSKKLIPILNLEKDFVKIVDTSGKNIDYAIRERRKKSQ